MAANLSNKPILLKIPYGFASAIVCKREERGHHVKTGKAYRTNRAVRAAAFFTYLKSLSSSGKITIDVTGFSNETGLSKDTVRTRITECVHVYGFAEYADNGAALLLHSWASVMRMVSGTETDDENSVQLNVSDSDNSPASARHAVRWCPGNFGQLIYVFAALEIRENKDRIEYMYQKKVLNLRLRNELESIGIYSRENHAAVQYAAFTQRSAHPVSLIHAINADNNRSVPTIRAAHGYKSRRSVGYLKKRLHLLGLVIVTRRRIESTSADFTRDFHTSFNRASGKRTTYLPDALTLNPNVFGQ